MSAGPFTNTTLNATIPEIWDLRLDQARYEASVIMQRVLNKSELVKKYGDIINLTYKDKLTVVNISPTDGTFAVQNYAPTNVPVTIDQWKGTPIEVVDKAQYQSFWDPKSDLPADAGKALAETVDTALGALYSNLTSNIIGSSSAPTPFDDVSLLGAMLKLRNRSIPLDDLSFFLPPIAMYGGILTKPEFRDAEKTGLPKSVLTTNYRGNLLGVPAYESTLLATVDSARAGLLLHKSAFAIGMQKNNEYRVADGVAAGKMSHIAIVASLYGLRVFREDHGCLIYVRAS